MKFTPVKMLAVAAVAALPLLASAQLSTNVSLTSNYKFRGQDQDTGRSKGFKPALQGGFDYAHESGFYIGNWNSSVNWLAGNSLESDIYGGYKFKASDLDFDVGALQYIYPGAKNANTTELYGAVTFAGFTAKYSGTISEGYFGVGKATSDGRGTGYLNLSYGAEVAPKLTLKAALGFTRFTSDAKNNYGAVNYADYSVGLGYDLGDGFSLSGAVVGATKKDNAAFAVATNNGGTLRVNRPTLIVTLTKAM